MTRLEISLQIDLLMDQLITKYFPEKVILFGSATKAEGEVNDIDLFIVKKDIPELGADRIRQLYRLMETNLPVDYIVYRPDELDERLSLGDPFIAGILGEGKVLYG
jgi:predicted nucleotidyltransferase